MRVYVRGCMDGVDAESADGGTFNTPGSTCPKCGDPCETVSVIYGCFDCHIAATIDQFDKAFERLSK
jgi:hypothetical protein